MTLVTVPGSRAQRGGANREWERPPWIAVGSQLEAGAVARVVPARPEHAGSIQAEVDAVSGERRWNFSLRAPSLEEVGANLVQHLATDSPYFVALDGGNVVGHCEIQRSLRPGTWHVGLLGMGVIEPYRGRWIGARLLSTCLAAAWAAGMLRVELEVFSDNARARRLFGRAGFREEGVRHAARVIDGLVQDSLVMARLAPSIRELEAPGGWERFFELAAEAPRYRQQSWVSDAVTSQPMKPMPTTTARRPGRASRLIASQSATVRR